MENKGEFFDQSMDDIVFDRRNKSYGAYFLRETYKKHLLKAIGIGIGVFVFSLYTPKMAKAIGLFKDKPAEILDTTTITLTAPPSLKPDAPPPPPPPPEIEVQRPTEKFMEMLAVKKEEAEDPPPTVEELKDKDIGTEKVEGTATDDPPPIVEEVVGTGEVIDNKTYVDVDQKAQFIGGEEAMKEFLHDNLVYPEAEKLYEISGETIVSFVVTIDGKVEEVKVARSSGNAKLDAEAVRVIRKTTGRFKAGKINGKSVRSVCKIPITFELEDE